MEGLTEKKIIEKIQVMCEQSLYPELFEKWESVRDELEKRRKDLSSRVENNSTKLVHGVYCNYDDDEVLISVHKTKEGAEKNKKSQTDYQQEYYYVDTVVVHN